MCMCLYHSCPRSLNMGVLLWPHHLPNPPSSHLWRRQTSLQQCELTKKIFIFISSFELLYLFAEHLLCTSDIQATCFWSWINELRGSCNCLILSLWDKRWQRNRINFVWMYHQITEKHLSSSSETPKYSAIKHSLILILWPTWPR